ncbi:rRNA maturation protein [Methanococcus voltae]|jgi:U3 small nucleolar ribonucleoprotein protein IMP4|uniref:Probable Brix domain-containing ribosomal biogenesis protein n=2 Tax=Methanococcus voltae TaxID=2188 RepID=A0A8J7RF83_METVO|nr:rRNA maturation protein [Methanococcus voltae]MBP2172277.1 U3 small nucleolar ribonucleoprotein IMP4 [Methanococcus voltae]MBP2200767.1 U3 small nucleolar ribonucleoprotein IMP4 [Methanococcus voltae]MCS3921491.1 U3 small nucleolar ribonucleoprotein IMP4 [Methanococcus voltae PS]
MIITTSRKPSQRTRSLANDLSRVFNIKTVNRGKTSASELLEKYKNLIVIEELKGNPNKLKIYDVENNKVFSVIMAVKLQREIISEKIDIQNSIVYDFEDNCGEFRKLFTKFLFKNIKKPIYAINTNKKDNINYTLLKFNKGCEGVYFLDFYDVNESTTTHIGPKLKITGHKIFDIFEDEE